MVRAYPTRTNRQASPQRQGLARGVAGKKLGTYADRGRFPQNEVLPYRNPVFIDRHNTACAVGQLTIESGNEALARSIQHDMNLAYVHDMKRDDVFAWASASGFTENELVRIQPGYPPGVPWYGLAMARTGR